MKTLKPKLWLLLLLIIPSFTNAQYSTTVLTTTTYPQYIYVGTLIASSNNLGSYQKLKVDIFGGGWSSSGMGRTTYYIATRGSLQINQVTEGSSNDNLFTLQGYNNNSGGTDFYVVVTNTYASFGITSVILGGSIPITQSVPITQSSTLPSGTLISFNINPVLITDASGNIGIGTPNTNGYKFAVKGNLHAQQVNVDLTNWADYVFTPTYTLPTLSEVKTYIDQNHHLPEIPSEQEMIKNGMDVGEMNKLLVKKVEELTLYLIEKDKAINKQSDLLKQFEARLEKVEQAKSKN